MRGKKTELIGFRLSPEEKEMAEKVCVDLGQAPGAIAGILFDRFVKQRKIHGNRLVWPPEFDYYPTSSKTARKKTDLP